MLMRQVVGDVQDGDGVNHVMRDAARLMVIRHSFKDGTGQPPDSQQVGSYFGVGNAHQLRFHVDRRSSNDRARRVSALGQYS